MGTFSSFLILLLFIIEVGVLSYMDRKAWNTFFTPFNFLVIPYTIVLLITLCISGSNLGFVKFYYPSIMIWVVGSFLFAIPGIVLGYAMGNKVVGVSGTDSDVGQMPDFLKYLSLMIILLFIYRLRQTLGFSQHAMGSDDFGIDFCGGGLWGHLRQVSIVLLMMAIYYIDRDNRYMWLIIVPILCVCVLYQVKGWVIIPCLVGISMRIASGRTKLNAKILVNVMLMGSAAFAGSYLLSLAFAGDVGISNDILRFILRNFLHYLTSGTLGLSVDMQNGFPDRDGIEMLIAQFVNISHLFTGDELVIPLNPLYYNTGVNLTNVRTLFGTIFINVGMIGFVLFVLTISSLSYLLRYVSLASGDLFLNMIYFFVCGLLFMGWFDSYVASLTTIEIPVIILLLKLLHVVLHGAVTPFVEKVL